VQLTAENTAIVLDSTADYPFPERDHPNWRMVPLTVRFGEQSLRDYVEIQPHEFYRRLAAADELPRTAAPSPGAYVEVFEELAAFDLIVVLPVSSKVSASLQNAELAAKQHDPSGTRVLVVDGRSVSAGTALLALGVQRLLDAGSDDREVLAWLEAARERLGVLIYLDTLEYLEKGGRIGRAQAVVGSLLKVHPLLTLTDGEVAPHSRVRGRARVNAEFERFLCERVPEGGAGRAGIAHAGDPADLDALRRAIPALRPRVSIDRECEIGAVVGTYAGPRARALVVLPEG
jgi:DegV family protein with EDD domain